MSVCAIEESASLDLAQLCANAGPISVAPIDALYEDVAEIITLGEPSQLAASPALGRLMILGLVASTEYYFRTVLSSLVWICPLARQRVSDLTIRFGALDYYRSDEMALSLMEHQSLASGRELTKHVERVLGERPREGSSFAAAIDMFDQACELRHAAAHARGSIASHSAKALGLNVTGLATVAASFDGIQRMAAVCVSVARSFNRFAFESVAKQWMLEGVLHLSWNLDKPVFTPLHRIMYSRKDGVGPANPYISWRSLMAWRAASGFGTAS
jgi:hypothetical protein